MPQSQLAHSDAGVSRLTQRVPPVIFDQLRDEERQTPFCKREQSAKISRYE